MVRDLSSHYGDALARELSLAPPLPPPVEGPDGTWRGPSVGTEAWYEEREGHLRSQAEAAQQEEPPPAEPDMPAAETGEDDMRITDALKRVLGRGEPAVEPEPLNPWPVNSREWIETEAVIAADLAMPLERIYGDAAAPVAATPDYEPSASPLSGA